ncbi:DUF5671 domain-containing protein [Kordiimonas lacus]|uniref:DUF5671 domain-containing protein n=1 Tax=Kordiimonas lacus TaxID=637679 RepID=A0A1G6XNQ9_9PROT|nr:DUF5671 domain-containing protein [Kordiimonas lacus]SDD78997.1 hypothetical protein SAMN04488071_1282 [Kordiimonas lacus]
MATNQSLLQFVEKALGKGQSREDIATALEAAGWDKSEIKKALAAFAPMDFPVPVPSKHYSLAARDTVFYLFHFCALYLSSWGVIFLGFNILDFTIPDASSSMNADYIEGNIRYWVAWSIVFVLAYLVAAWKAEQRTKLDPNCPMSSGRQWLTYLTLFLAGMTALGDLVALIYHFLDGAATMRFLLKVAVVAGVSGGVLLYYFRSIKTVEDAEAGDAA